MTRSFWIFEVFLAVAGVLAGLIFHCIFMFYVNPQMLDINWTWMGFITVTMLNNPRLKARGFLTRCRLSRNRQGF